MTIAEKLAAPPTPTPKKGSKFAEPISKALVEGKTEINLGEGGVNQICLITDNAAIIKAGFKPAVSARIKALTALLPKGSYLAEAENGILRWEPVEV